MAIKECYHPDGTLILRLGRHDASISDKEIQDMSFEMCPTDSSGASSLKEDFKIKVPSAEDLKNDNKNQGKIKKFDGKYEDFSDYKAKWQSQYPENFVLPVKS